MKNTLRALLVLGLSAAAHAAASQTLDHYNVLWDSPSPDARGSMPIGNGDIGLNVWVEPSGDLCFFIGKTDAWDENLRLLKLNKVRVKFAPALDLNKGFRWVLNLADGVIDIQDANSMVHVWVDANHPVIHVNAAGRDSKKLAAAVTLEPWRKTKRPLAGSELHATGYTTLLPFLYPDVVLPAKSAQIGWYHRNEVSPWLESLKLQKIDAIAKTQRDPILNLTCGGILRGAGFTAVSATEMKSVNPAEAISLQFHLLTQITDTPEAWLKAVETQADSVEKLPANGRWQAHVRWWNEFWQRSWILIGGGQTLEMPVNQHQWHVGEAPNGGARFGGVIEDAAITGRALSAAEIAALAAKPRSGSKTITGTGADCAQGCTAAAWIQPGVTEGGRILDKCTPGMPDGFLFDTYPGLSLRWTVGKHVMIQRDCLKAGEWRHVAATADAATGVRRIYLDGKLLEEASGEASGEIVTRGYILQRWINACGGRGAFPIKFNGSLFVVDNAGDADYRAWGGNYWFQNTRLTYWTMLSAGDFDLMQPFFAMYMKALPARKLATRNYYGHDGAFYPETMTFWGNYADQGVMGYGVDRNNKEDGLSDNTYVRRYWQGGLEMVTIMLDYYALTQDAKFRDDTLIPFATEIITFFDRHWKRGADGKILFFPAQSLETWHSAQNPTPEIAALRYIIPRLQAVTGSKLFHKTLDDLPPLPLSDTEPKRIIPAETLYGEIRNVENPELYAIFPYRLYGIGKPDIKTALETWRARRIKRTGGWHQDAIQAALLGRADEARELVEANASVHAQGFRFPAIWGPNYDWMPDQDHGSVMLSALQRMLIQYEGRKILLLPAWPKEWDCNFKLHAPFNTVLHGRVKDGKIVGLEVTPETRRKDVVVGGSAGDGI